MKKHDEGYVLAYVTVVLLIFCLVATTILTGAMRNLEQQQNANQKMKDQYAAAGMIEQVLAQWNTYKNTLDVAENIGNTGVQCMAIGKWENPATKEEIKETVTLYAQEGSVSITCVLKKADAEVISYQINSVDPKPTETGGEVE